MLAKAERSIITSHAEGVVNDACFSSGYWWSTARVRPRRLAGLTQGALSAGVAASLGAMFQGVAQLRNSQRKTQAVCTAEKAQQDAWIKTAFDINFATCVTWSHIQTVPPLNLLDFKPLQSSQQKRD